MTRDEYCINVCGAKCCRDAMHELTCMHLCADNKCAVYAQRFKASQPDVLAVSVQSKGDKLYVINCTRIEKLIADNKLPPEIAAQCCYAHPELLTQESRL